MSEYRLTGEDRDIFDRAVELGYIVARKRNAMALDAWRVWCWRNRRPMVIVGRRVKYANVVLDMDSSPLRFTNQQAEMLLDAIMRPYLDKRGWFCTGNYSEMFGVQLDRAEALARDLVRAAGLAKGHYCPRCLRGTGVECYVDGHCPLQEVAS